MKICRPDKNPEPIREREADFKTTCQYCQYWTRMDKKLYDEWNLCDRLSQNTLNESFLIPSWKVFPEMKKSCRVRICHTFRDFGCIMFKRRKDNENTNSS